LRVKRHGSWQDTLLAEEELDRADHAIDGAVEIHPATAPPDISFINVPLASDRMFPTVEASKQQQCEMNDLRMDRGVVDVNSALGHHLFQITQAEIVSEVPSYTQQSY
jgi:hypothetical protein